MTGQPCHYLRYADDLTLLALSAAALETASARLGEALAQSALTPNTDKTQVRSVDSNEPTKLATDWFGSAHAPPPSYKQQQTCKAGTVSGEDVVNPRPLAECRAHSCLLTRPTKHVRFIAGNCLFVLPGVPLLAALYRESDSSLDLARSGTPGLYFSNNNSAAYLQWPKLLGIMGRTAVFIDGGYAFNLTKELGGGVRFDYGKVARSMAGDGELLRTYYYDCMPYQSHDPTSDERQALSTKRKFFHAISQFDRFEIRQGKTAYRGQAADGSPLITQKRVDTMLATDMVELAVTGQVDTVCLLAGDSDFIPALEAVKRQGVLVVLWHGAVDQSRASVHRELYDTADVRIKVDDRLARQVAL